MKKNTYCKVALWACAVIYLTSFLWSLYSVRELTRSLQSSPRDSVIVAIEQDDFVLKNATLFMLEDVLLNTKSYKVSKLIDEHEHLKRKIWNKRRKTVETENINVLSGSAISKWQKKIRSNETRRNYFLVEILMVRLYEHDKARWTLKELKQWLHYMLWAGVEHVYMCNHYDKGSEKLNSSLTKYIQSGILTYVDWPWNASSNSGDIKNHQMECYNRVFRRFGHTAKWIITTDMDEYPFCKNDVDEGFLKRYIHKFFIFKGKHICQFLMQNYLMLGEGDRSKNMTIERITQIVEKPTNDLTKTIIRSDCVERFEIHTHIMTKGSRILPSDPSELMMIHFWGQRLQNKLINENNGEPPKTVDFNHVSDSFGSVIRQSLLSFGENDAFSNSTGP
ncbi:hypothetical protein CHS0354_028714 [Potamilus streckersoni]|uniref:Glycosyltransferase family 92 protein n=1 Tax=Potamilus streckersoni TaxID=2493646 RepID=A0AAE0SZC9_9BIVA|nr:hypothetical protein CHS0354_028714 [Potamilus streckersoni]